MIVFLYINLIKGENKVKLNIYLLNAFNKLILHTPKSTNKNTLTKLYILFSFLFHPYLLNYQLVVKL